MPSQPFEEAITGWTANPDSFEDWPNTVTVNVTSGWIPHQDGLYPLAQDRVTDGDYADQADERQLVEIDTNYKPTRTSEYPVALTRADTIHLATALLTAVDDTFDNRRLGRLRAVEAAALLRLLPEVECAVADLREHALTNLLRDTNSDPDDQPETETDAAEEGRPHE